jgi:uncharacterized protein
MSQENADKFSLKKELKTLIEIIKVLDQKVVAIFLSVAVLQTISWYYTSRKFFRENFFEDLQFNPNVYLIEYLYWFVGDFFTFFILPLLIIKILFKENFKNFGVTVGDYKTGLKISLIFLAFMFPLIWIVSASGEFAQTYPHLQSAKSSWTMFFIFEAGIFLYMISWEFFWRGYMLFGLKEKFGYYAVLIQMIPFLILHNGKPAPETFGAILGGIALGILALRTGSFFYCVITHAGVMFTIDFISALRFRANDYGIGIDSFLNIIKEIF